MPYILNFFKNLPNEIILKIFKKNSQEDLEKIVRVDKRFNYIVNEGIKSCIKIGDLINSKLHNFTLSRTNTILDLKKQIANKTGTKIDRQTLIFNGIKLEDNKTIANYRIDDVHNFVQLL